MNNLKWKQQKPEPVCSQTLITAIKANNIHLVRTCVEGGVDVNYNLLFPISHTPLTEATIIGNLEIITYLINKGANVNEGGYTSYTPLFAAVKRNNNSSLDVIKFLVDNGATVNDTDSRQGDTPITTAIQLRNLPVLEYLISAKADVNKIGGAGKTPLAWAITINNLQAVKILVDNGADIKKPNVHGPTPLVLAKILNLNEIFNYLFIRVQSDPLHTKNNVQEAKAVDRTNCGLGEYSPLGKAVLTGNITKVETLLKAGVDVCKECADGRSPLKLAVQSKNLEIIKLLLEHGAELTIQTAFLESININSTEITKYLLKHKVLLNITYRSGCTPLTRSIEKQNLKIVKALLEKGADVNMADRDGNRPLCVSLKAQSGNITKYLIDQGAKLNKEWLEKDTFEKAGMLRKHGVNLNTVFEDTHSILMKAIEMENLAMVKYLVEQGTTVNQVDNTKQSPLQLALSTQCFGIVKFLIDSGANIIIAEKELERYAEDNEDFDVYFKTLEF